MKTSHLFLISLLTLSMSCLQASGRYDLKNKDYDMDDMAYAESSHWEKERKSSAQRNFAKEKYNQQLQQARDKNNLLVQAMNRSQSTTKPAPKKIVVGSAEWAQEQKMNS